MRGSRPISPSIKPPKKGRAQGFRAAPRAISGDRIPGGLSSGGPSLIRQRAIANSIADFTRRYGFTPRDRTLGLSALGFDLSVFDIFCPLSAGGAIVLPDADRLRDPEHWADLARRHGVTVWQSVLGDWA